MVLAKHSLLRHRWDQYLKYLCPIVDHTLLLLLIVIHVSALA